jgi:hypothetical protein
MQIPKTNFKLGQLVYLKTDLDQLPRQVVAITFNISGGTPIYTLSSGDLSSGHHEEELQEEQSIIV